MRLCHISFDFNYEKLFKMKLMSPLFNGMKSSLEKKPGTVFLNVDKSPLCLDMNINSPTTANVKKLFHKQLNCLFFSFIILVAIRRVTTSGSSQRPDANSM